MKKKHKSKRANVCTEPYFWSLSNDNKHKHNNNNKNKSEGKSETPTKCYIRLKHDDNHVEKATFIITMVHIEYNQKNTFFYSRLKLFLVVVIVAVDVVDAVVAAVVVVVTIVRLPIISLSCRVQRVHIILWIHVIFSLARSFVHLLVRARAREKESEKKCKLPRACIEQCQSYYYLCHPKYL